MFAHFLSYLDAKGESSSSKKGTAMPLRSWKLKWVWWAQFLSYAPQTLLKCKSFGDTQMILKWIFETSSHLKSTKNQFEFQSILKQSLCYHSVQDKNYDFIVLYPISQLGKFLWKCGKFLSIWIKDKIIPTIYYSKLYGTMK